MFPIQLNDYIPKHLIFIESFLPSVRSTQYSIINTITQESFAFKFNDIDLLNPQHCITRIRDIIYFISKQFEECKAGFE